MRVKLSKKLYLTGAILLFTFDVVVGIILALQSEEGRGTSVPKITTVVNERDNIKKPPGRFTGTGTERVGESNGVTTYKLTCYYSIDEKNVTAIEMGTVNSSEDLPDLADRCL